MRTNLLSSETQWKQGTRQPTTDVLACTACGGRLQVIAFIAEALVAARLLDHLGLDSCGPPLTRVQAPPEPFDPGPSYDAPDSPYPA